MEDEKFFYFGTPVIVGGFPIILEWVILITNRGGTAEGHSFRPYEKLWPFYDKSPNLHVQQAIP